MTVSLSATHTVSVVLLPSCSPSPSTPNPCRSGEGQVPATGAHCLSIDMAMSTGAARAKNSPG